MSAGDRSIITDGLIFCMDISNKKVYSLGYETINDVSKNQNDGSLSGDIYYTPANNGAIIFNGG